jgi:hypothetical protein
MGYSRHDKKGDGERDEVLDRIMDADEEKHPEQQKVAVGAQHPTPNRQIEIGKREKDRDSDRRRAEQNERGPSTHSADPDLA